MMFKSKPIKYERIVDGGVRDEQRERIFSKEDLSVSSAKKGLRLKGGARDGLTPIFAAKLGGNTIDR